MKKRSFAFIKARWHANIVDQAYAGFCEAMAAKGQAFDIQAHDVPGAFEMPLLAKRLGETGRFDAIVAVVLVVDGGIWRHDFVAQAVVSRMMQAQMETGVPTFSVSLTPHHFQPSAEHHDFYLRHFVKKPGWASCLRGDDAGYPARHPQSGAASCFLIGSVCGAGQGRWCQLTRRSMRISLMSSNSMMRWSARGTTR